MQRLVPILLAAALAGCASHSAGPQTVAVRSDPPGAACTVERAGTVIGTVDPTPGALAVDHSDKPLTVTCRKPGWLPATGTVAAIYKGIGLGQLLTGGAASVVEDAVKSTDFTYDGNGVTVVLPPGR